MVKRRSKSSGKRRGLRNGSAVNGAGNTKGDLPKPHRYDQTTVSCRIPRVTNNYVVRQMTSSSQLVATPTAGANLTYYFQLSNLANATSFENVFDQYRIVAIRQTVRPDNNAVGLVTNSTTSLVDLYWVIDYDNTSNLGSTGAAISYDNCMILAPGESGSRTFCPRIAVAAYSGAFTSFANMQDSWIDSASPNVQHYGTKFYVPGATAAQTLLQSWEIRTEYWVEFRSQF